jgi:aminoglycoside/choline kinase family phosphotransferase
MSTNEVYPVAPAAPKPATEETIAAVVVRELRLDSGSLRVARLAGDASTRGYFRASYPGGSVVAVHYPVAFSAEESSGQRLERWCAARPADGRETFANDPLCHVELTALFAERGVPVPALVAVADRDSVLLVEDVGDDLLQGWLRGAGAAEREAAYERAIDLIASIRAATEVVAGSNMVAGLLAFDEAKLGWELAFFADNCFARFLGAPLGPDLGPAVDEDCRGLAAELAARPRHLCHRDYHARNLMLWDGAGAAGGLVVIDFQDARLGPATYDLVSILEDPYVPLEPEFRARMRGRFCDRLREDGDWPGEDAFDEEYDLMAAQRLLKAVGTYTHQAAACGKDVYVQYIGPAVAEAKAALDRLGRFAALRRALDRIN